MNTQRGMFEAWADGKFGGLESSSEKEMAWDAWQAAVAAQENSKLSWQPIDTAPKDGTRVIIFSERRGAREARFYRENEKGTEWFDVIVGGGPVTHFYDATHWMPLPQEPAK